MNDTRVKTLSHEHRVTDYVLFGATGQQSFCRRLRWGGSTSVAPPS